MSYLLFFVKTFRSDPRIKKESDGSGSNFFISITDFIQ